MATEQFCLRWNDFHANITAAFSEIKEDEDFLDVTLVCDGDMVRAHKLVLSACSPLFRVMLKKNSHPQPMIFLRGIRFPDMVAILNFMYHGEVNVNQEDLQMFLAAAEELRIKGLSQASNEGNLQTVPKKKLSMGGTGSQPPMKKAREGSPGGGSPASSGPGSARSPGLEDGDGDAPQLAVKREFASGRDNPSRQEAEDEDGSNQGQGNLLDCLMQAGQSHMSYGGGNSGGQGGFEQNNFGSPQHMLPGGGGLSVSQNPDSKGVLGPGRGGSPAPSMKFGAAGPGGGLPYEMHRLGGRNEDGLAHMVVMKTFRGWHCPHCSYISPSQKGNLKVHILNRHANPGESFACMFCGKHLSSRSSLQVHISQVHREQQKAKRMLEERLKITTLEERLKTEMTAAGGQLSLEMGAGMGTAEALRQAMQHEDRMRAQHELGGMMGPQQMARILAMGGQEGFESGNASSSGSVPHSPRPPQQQEGSPGYSPSTVSQQLERKPDMQADRQTEPMRQPERQSEGMRQAEAMRQSEALRQSEAMRHPDGMRQQPESMRQAEVMRQPENMRQPETMRQPDPMRQPENMRQPEPMSQSEPMRQQDEPSTPSSETHYHKDSGGDAVSVYPKEMVEPNLVYHKNVGGHSVSIYPKDLMPGPEAPSYPSNNAAASLAPAHYPSSPMTSGASYQGGMPSSGHHHAMGAPHATTPSD